MIFTDLEGNPTTNLELSGVKLTVSDTGPFLVVFGRHDGYGDQVRIPPEVLDDDLLADHLPLQGRVFDPLTADDRAQIHATMRTLRAHPGQEPA